MHDVAGSNRGPARRAAKRVASRSVRPTLYGIPLSFSVLGRHSDEPDYVLPPSRFLEVASYPRAAGKRRYLLLCERPTDGMAVRWSVFRKAAPSDIPATQRATPRTTAITNDVDADRLLRLWDARGRFRKRR